MAMNYQSAVRSTGKVNWFSDDEGFGFITPDDGGEKLFVQQSSIVSFGVTSLTVGELVEYVIRRGKGGIAEAAKVTALGFGVECFICGNLGHIARNCTQSIKCFGCGNLGHIAKDCTQSEVQCYSCQKFGHKARNCPQGGGGSGGGGGGVR